MARRRYSQGRGMDNIDWMKALKSTAGGIAGGIGGTLTGFLGLPLGVGGHIATEYFADERDMDMIGKSISNGLIGGGIGSSLATMSAMNISGQLRATEELNYDTLTKYGEASLSAQLMRPSAWLNEQLMGLTTATRQTVRGVGDLLTRDELEQILEDYDLQGEGFIE